MENPKWKSTKFKSFTFQKIRNSHMHLFSEIQTPFTMAHVGKPLLLIPFGRIRHCVLIQRSYWQHLVGGYHFVNCLCGVMMSGKSYLWETLLHILLDYTCPMKMLRVGNRWKCLWSLASRLHWNVRKWSLMPWLHLFIIDWKAHVHFDDTKSSAAGGKEMGKLEIKW